MTSYDEMLVNLLNEKIIRLIKECNSQRREISKLKRKIKLLEKEVKAVEE